MTTITANTSAAYIPQPGATSATHPVYTDIPMKRSADALALPVAAPLERAIGVGANPLPSPQPVALEPGAQVRLEDIGKNHRADLRLMLGKIQMQERERELAARESQTKADMAHIEVQYASVAKSEQAARHTRDAGLVAGFGEMAGGFADAGAGATAFGKGKKANEAANEKFNQKDIEQSHKQKLGDDKSVAKSLQKEIRQLESQRAPRGEGQTTTDPDTNKQLDREINDKRAELESVNRSIDGAPKNITEARQKAKTAEQRENELRSVEQILLPLGRGIGAIFNGIAKTAATQLEFEAAQKKQAASRLDIAASILQTQSKGFDDQANDAHAASQKADDLYRELVQTEATTNQKIFS